jgi:hypothetical protein
MWSYDVEGFGIVQTTYSAKENSSELYVLRVLWILS